MTTDERLEKLEKGLASARRLNRWLLAAVGLALGVWILAGTFGPTMAAAPAGTAAASEPHGLHRYQIAVDEHHAGPWVIDTYTGDIFMAYKDIERGPDGKLKTEPNKTPLTWHKLLDGPPR